MMGKVNFLLGRDAIGKTQSILTTIGDQCIKNPLGDPIFLITPEQMTFHTEYHLLRMNSSKSIVRANVTSFTRLAHRIMQEVGGLSRYHLDEVGKAMLLQKIMLMSEEELGVFSRYIQKPGFIQKMDELFSEFKSYQIDANTLKLKVNETNLGNKTKQKITTLATIFEEFNAITLSQYLTTEDYFTFLIAIIEKSEQIKKADIYIDGYHTFNAQERAIIEQLAHHARSLTIILTVDTNVNDLLWTTTQNTYSDLSNMLVRFNPAVTNVSKKVNIQKPEALAHLEQFFMQQSIPFQKDIFNDEINFIQASNRRQEIEAVANSIHRLIKQKAISFSNIAIYTSNPQSDQHLYETIFAKYELPYFLDYKTPMLIHPVVSLLHKLLDVFNSNWHSPTVFSILKTGLFVDVKNVLLGSSYDLEVLAHLTEVDDLENYVLAHDIKKYQWQSGNVNPNTETQFLLPLVELESKLDNSHTVVEFSQLIFKFLEELEIPKKLQLMTLQAEADGDLKLKKQHEQVWSKLLRLFEQVVEIAADQKISIEDFTQIMKTGLEQLSFATVPASLDAIQIGDINRSRYQLVPDFVKSDDFGVKHAFIIGVNDGMIPSVPVESSLLSEKERLALASLELELAPNLITTQQNEIFSMYTILAGAKNSVTMTYSTENNSHPSHVLNHVRQLFPVASVTTYVADKSDAPLTTPAVLFEKIIASASTPSFDYHTNSVLKYYERHERLQYNLIMHSLNFSNQVEPILSASDLYGTEVEASVSRLERFNNCQFAHYLSYGLKLQERKVFELEVANIGNLFHEALKYISLLLKKENRSFTSITQPEVKKLTDHAIDYVLKHDKAFAIFEATNRMRALKIKLTQVVHKTVNSLRVQANKSNFKETYFELEFGSSNQLIKTSARQIGDTKLSLKGIIDRIDIGISEQQKKYLRIVDYKSGKKELELDSAYYGLSLQLLTYLDVALEHFGVEYDNAGALYFHVHNPYLQENQEILTSDSLDEIVSASQTAKFRMNGYLPENHEVARMSDLDLDNGTTKSDVVPITLKKDGNFSTSGTRTLVKEDFDLLRQHTKDKITATVSQMIDGEVSINPASHKGKTACDWCKFKSVCKFEAGFNTYRNLPTMKNEEVLQQLNSSKV